MSLEPTDEELMEAIDQCGGDFHLLDLRELMRHLTPIIARKRRDATVGWLQAQAREMRGLTRAAIVQAADAIARDEDLG